MINYKTGFVEWVDLSLPLRDPKGLSPKEFDETEDVLFIQQDDDFLGEDYLARFLRDRNTGREI